MLQQSTVSTIVVLAVIVTLPPFVSGFSPPTSGVIVHQSSNKLIRSSTTCLNSIPNSIDTFTSGLASIARLSDGGGVAVSDRAVSQHGPAAKYLPKVKKLYDVENDRDSRLVRERITELDLIVEQVIPSASNSRARANGKKLTIPTMVVEENDGTEVSLSGTSEIITYLNRKFTAIDYEGQNGNGVEITRASEEFTGDQIMELLKNALSYAPDILRAGRGSSVCTAAEESNVLDPPPRPQEPLILYSYEANQFCRLVREVLHELDIPYELRSAGKHSKRRDELARIAGGSSQQPFLVDPNTKVKKGESKDIVEYLYERYARWTPPSETLQGASSVITQLLGPIYKIITPLQAGSASMNEFEYQSEVAEARAEIFEEVSSRPVVVYTYEWSPFCSDTTILLKSAGIRFKEVSLGLEWLPGLIKEPLKRAALLEITGQSSLPHVFIGGDSVGGLYSGTPGLLPAIESGELQRLVEVAKTSMRG